MDKKYQTMIIIFIIFTHLLNFIVLILVKISIHDYYLYYLYTSPKFYSVDFSNNQNIKEITKS
jgi:hypothetical protein